MTGDILIPNVILERPAVRNPEFTSKSDVVPDAKLSIDAHQVITTSFQPAHSSSSDHLWVFAGTLSGLTLGCISNYLQRGSVFASDVYDCRYYAFDNIYAFEAVNQLREGSALALHPIMGSALLTVPLLINALQLSDSQKTSSYLQNMRTRLKSVYVDGICPTRPAIALVGLVWLVGVELIKNLPGIDISGHAISAISINVMTREGLKVLNETGASKLGKLYNATAAILAITDVVWMYNTAANCHSIVDILAGLAVAAVGYGAGQGLIWSCDKILPKAWNLTTSVFDTAKSSLYATAGACRRIYGGN